MAEVFVNLVTGAALPDTGEVHVFGRLTSAISDSEEWLTVVDRFGIVSDRGVLLDSLTVLQNLAVPFTLEIDPLSEGVAAQAADLAREVGLEDSEWTKPVGALNAADRARIRLARSIALDPALILLEHPTAGVDPADTSSLADRVRSIAVRRGAAVIALTADHEFATAVAERVLSLEAATGRLTDSRRWRFSFRRS
jgi:phospholipid/cholesterol/gamma-HCH transport system ATP-binding protein